MKNKYIILLFMLTTSILVFGFSGYKFINKKTNENLIITEDPETEILGFWVLENDPSTKIEFTIDGYIKSYTDNQLESTDLYQITNTCEGETLSNNEKFLKIIDSNDASIFCSIINGVNANNSNILSLTTSNQGKLVVYIRP
ncbi:hypothetical protein [Flavobacterium lacisediminis]|uniref:Lipocalin-like domain-containing protein n=1 Tax=Flavobacterium lacisediminis TaxID=2989705 RepID=A0ABT3EF64_9FLAO|nr:hypothetical protein [Flavobacterium lacisediminis]MCW1147197.1 hypothetical protein [Flavobacterium lacisediminis]